MDLTPFNTAIKNHLDKLAKEDLTFAVTYAKPNKSIEECCKYIMQEVEKSRKGADKCVAVSDDEVFGLAIHYYDEDDIKVDGPKSAVKVSQNATAEETPTTSEHTEEKPKARRIRKSKVEADPNIPEPLDIPIF